MKARTHLAYVKASRPTGRKMAELLGVTTHGTHTPVDYVDVLIRWGSRIHVPNVGMQINSAAAINKASDKVEAITLMQAAGLPTIPCYTTFNDAIRRAPMGVVLGRSRRGFGGKDIVVYKANEQPDQTHDFYTPWYDAPREYRIHVVGEKVIRVQGKYLDFPDKAVGNPYVKNYAHGYRFRAPKNDIRPRRKQVAVEAVQALGLDFGAVDMLVWGEGPEQYILEVNTAPACSPLTARCYVGEIALHVQQKTSGQVRLARGLLEMEVEYDEQEDW